MTTKAKKWHTHCTAQIRNIIRRVLVLTESESTCRSQYPFWVADRFCVWGARTIRRLDVHKNITFRRVVAKHRYRLDPKTEILWPTLPLGLFELRELLHRNYPREGNLLGSWNTLRDRVAPVRFCRLTCKFVVNGAVCRGCSTAGQTSTSLFGYCSNFKDQGLNLEKVGLNFGEHPHNLSYYLLYAQVDVREL